MACVVAIDQGTTGWFVFKSAAWRLSPTPPPDASRPARRPFCRWFEAARPAREGARRRAWVLEQWGRKLSAPDISRPSESSPSASSARWCIAPCSFGLRSWLESPCGLVLSCAEGLPLGYVVKWRDERPRARRALGLD